MASRTYVYLDLYRKEVVLIGGLPTFKFSYDDIPIIDLFKLSVLRIKKFHSEPAASEE